METHTVVFSGGPHDGETRTIKPGPDAHVWEIKDGPRVIGYYRTYSGKVVRGQLVARWRDVQK
jgi:hypothetical protein